MDISVVKGPRAPLETLPVGSPFRLVVDGRLLMRITFGTSQADGYLYVGSGKGYVVGGAGAAVSSMQHMVIPVDGYFQEGDLCAT